MASVALVSAAQLGMRWSMSRLPSPVQWLEMQEHAQLDLSALRVVCASITAYALSMLFWLLALRVLPLSRAYSLLSISYALVYTLAAALPFFHETFTVSKTVGVSLIVAGVLTINLRRIPRPSPQDLSHENQRFR
ncbi:MULTISPECIES: 4-amino-4-deoxy-L-arabinose-phosphoundecaprenol flippase subunit ArnF [Pseudomonas]|uniref:4-amino-4-deoxy-L-arabinose-phosphoundecaprenol flippase subunit ArnF n=1 Tax=Pseudomonas TaxID=286 RepID=UPI0004667048|nr:MULTISPECIES: 4-amino-4-deoxy-L-arabinose-phosphoundecaprenol flippase subunit ArnF [Pseudomonas]KWS09688.1 4-amino-4-deoxy-L-arabinose-phospho-UDP flippase [Pseudomonas syringae pv. syringae]KWS25874.1 4-amino-4-deoxy-L-arabinose-phospho-UDP flippase [Pseudomonas syringae pv. syringae]MCH5487885.1 4-amino-4-deoxy-L-arabinose-phosphoundecaprenol flippase subunit ArnF [Pseudomonas syringae pv. syringae]MCH5535897.1 4-amino-4-deoxy-L-arabinose-phosphoundecaprenol flippase subunit ArnF [Pseudom